jgi:hypothetical protein
MARRGINPLKRVSHLIGKVSGAFGGESPPDFSYLAIATGMPEEFKGPDCPIT